MAVTGYATLRQVVYDMLNDFRQLHADADITPFQMAYWVLIHADRLRKQHIEKIDSGAFVVRFDVPVEVEPVTDRKYFTLPANVYDFNRDEGINYVTYSSDIDWEKPVFASTQFTRTSPSKSRRLYFREDERPAPDNPYFYRMKDRVYLLGVEPIDFETVEIGLYSTLEPNDMNMDLDQPFDFVQDLIPILKRQVLDLGAWVINVPKDLQNDPQAAGGQVPQKKFLGVQDAVNPNLDQQEA